MAMLEPSENVLGTRVGDEVILLDLARSEYFGLRGSGVRLWELIEQKTNTPDDMIRRMSDEFAADEHTIRADVTATLARLSQRGLIRER